MYSYKQGIEPDYNQYMLSYLSKQSYFTGVKKFFMCRNPEHNDHTPSMMFNPKNNKVHCFSCGVTYGLIDLVMIDHQLNYHDAVNYIRTNLMGTTPIQCNVSTQTCDFRVFYQSLDKDYTYLNKRGLNSFLCEKMGVRHNPINDSIIITNGIDCYTERFTTGDIRYKHYGKIDLYNRTQPSNPDKWTIIVEGEVDCLSVYEAINFNEGVYSSVSKLPLNCIALGSCNNWRRLVNSGINRLILALDNDDAGQRATNELAVELVKRGIDFYIVNLYDEFKDANDILLWNRKKFQLNIKKVLQICKKGV